MDFTYKILIAGVIIVIVGWIAYGIWWYRIQQEKKKEPGKKTEHLEKVKKSFEDYTKKMAEYKLKPYERKKEDKKGGV